MDHLEFRPIQVDRDREWAVRFQLDAYRLSFGSPQGFLDQFGEDGVGYVEWLKRLLEGEPRAAVHLWKGAQIIGQMELGRLEEDSSAGYIHFFYLVPEARGQGLGRRLDDYAAEYFRARGLVKMRLSVTKKNADAVGFYRHLGWRLVGEDERRPGVLMMEKSL